MQVSVCNGCEFKILLAFFRFNIYSIPYYFRLSITSVIQCTCIFFYPFLLQLYHEFIGRGGGRGKLFVHSNKLTDIDVFGAELVLFCLWERISSCNSPVAPACLVSVNTNFVASFPFKIALVLKQSCKLVARFRVVSSTMKGGRTICSSWLTILSNSTHLLYLIPTCRLCILWIWADFVDAACLLRCLSCVQLTGGFFQPRHPKMQKYLNRDVTKIARIILWYSLTLLASSAWRNQESNMHMQSPVKKNSGLVLMSYTRFCPKPKDALPFSRFMCIGIFSLLQSQ